MSNTILVTGATGNIGSHVVKQLTAVGATVRAAVQTTSKVEAIKGPRVQLVELDFNQKPFGRLSKALKEYSCSRRLWPIWQSWESSRWRKQKGQE